jgi:hypothetical protein
VSGKHAIPAEQTCSPSGNRQRGRGSVTQHAELDTLPMSCGVGYGHSSIPGAASLSTYPVLYSVQGS